MKNGPDIAEVAALIGDPARANILAALMSGKALTASELAAEAGVTRATASSHLSKLENGGLLTARSQGRHRYFTLANAEVGNVLETLMGLAARQGQLRTRTGPKDAAMRQARVCYDHLAGDLSVRMFDSLTSTGVFAHGPKGLSLTDASRARMVELGIDLIPLDNARRPLCRSCLDWSERRSHLAGGLGAALLTRFYVLNWARRVPDSRVVTFTPKGVKAVNEAFPLA